MAKWVLKFAACNQPNDIFEMVKSGQKTIESRPLNLDKKRNYGQVKPGDILVCVSLDTKEKIEKTVKRAKVYKSVREMAENEPVGQIIPGVKTSEELVAVFEELKKKWGKNYSRKLGKYGIVAMGMK